MLKVRHKESDLRPGTWVRVKRGKYAMDLAQVITTLQLVRALIGS